MKVEKDFAHSQIEDSKKCEKALDLTKRVLHAQEVFKQMGLKIGRGGFIEGPFLEEQIATLSKWSEETSSHGALMPTVENFCEKTLLAVSLWRQRNDDGDITYLIGKGSGVEIALLGSAKRRKTRQNYNASYRSHSDFELYAVCKKIYTDEFVYVFGAQEYFPETKTKGLSNIPQSLLHKTAQTVDFGGIEILVPQLEILFLDKWLARESTPRPEGYDDECLARKYELDLPRLHNYLEQFVIKPKLQCAIDNYQNKAELHLQAIERLFRGNLDKYKNRNKAAGHLNADMEIFENNPTEVEMGGVSSLLWIPLDNEDQFDEEGNLVDEELKRQIYQKAAILREEILEGLNSLHRKLDKYFEKINEDKVM